MGAQASRRPAGPVVAAALLAVVLAVVLHATGALRGAEFASVDQRFTLRAGEPSEDVVVVAIDEQTIAEFGVWPFSRRRHAELVDRLRRAGAELIVYDVQFTEASPDPVADLALYRALGRAGGAVLATSISDRTGATNVLGGDDRLARIDSRAGSSNMPDDREGVIRHYRWASGRLSTLAVVAEQRLTGGRLQPSDFGAGGRAWIDFRGGPGSIRTVSFADVHAGRVGSETLRDRVVVVGATASTLQDLHPTSTSGARQMAGPEIQAHAIATALSGNPLRDAPPWTVWALIAALGTIGPLVHLRRGIVSGLVATVVTGAVFTVAAAAAFLAGVVVAVVAPLVALAVGGLAAATLGGVVEARERRQIDRYSHELEAEVARRTEALEAAQVEAVQRLAQAAESRDETTGAHLERMSGLVHDLALRMGFAPADALTLRHAALLHDVGKIAVPDAILRKPGRLTPEEFAEMQQHTVAGAAMLAGSSSPVLRLAETIARTHHERWDGAGYPHRIAGGAIPLEGRICAVCDVFDALVSERPYKRAWPVSEAVAEIERLSGTHFDPAVVGAFLPMVRERHAGDDPPFVAGVADQPSAVSSVSMSRNPASSASVAARS